MVFWYISSRFGMLYQEKSCNPGAKHEEICVEFFKTKMEMNALLSESAPLQSSQMGLWGKVLGLTPNQEPWHTLSTTQRKNSCREINLLRVDILSKANTWHDISLAPMYVHICIL
jgi:hypothetical protein